MSSNSKIFFSKSDELIPENINPKKHDKPEQFPEYSDDGDDLD